MHCKSPQINTSYVLKIGYISPLPGKVYNKSHFKCLLRQYNNVAPNVLPATYRLGGSHLEIWLENKWVYFLKMSKTNRTSRCCRMGCSVDKCSNLTKNFFTLTCGYKQSAKISVCKSALKYSKSRPNQQCSGVKGDMGKLRLHFTRCRVTRCQ